jgi:hypothetical protein
MLLKARPSSNHSNMLRQSSSFDADSLGNRNVYVDGTFAPFSGIYESGVRFRLTGNASWYKFVTSEDPRTGGEPVTALLRGSGA